MIKHIVMWKLKEHAAGAGAQENARILKTLLLELKDSIPHIKEIEVGFNFNPSEAACDVVLYSVFESRDDLETYQKHPEHRKVVGFVNEIRSDRHVVDYET